MVIDPSAVVTTTCHSHILPKHTILAIFFLFSMIFFKKKTIIFFIPVLSIFFQFVERKNTVHETFITKTASLPILPMLPQNLTFGRYKDEKGKPFITQDMWADIVDNRRTFFLRPTEANMPTPEQLKQWIRNQKRKITLIINNQHDKSWPEKIENRTSYDIILDESNLMYVFAGNARKLVYYPKLKPLPIGPKWSFKRTMLFGEPKNALAEKYKKFCSTSPHDSEKLFMSGNRSTTVYFRPMTFGSNRRTRNYFRDTPALKTVRWEVARILNESAKHSIIFENRKIPQEKMFKKMKEHRFVVSPAGNGLDTHATWEALLCGCIPIVPKSDLDELFEDLPVWLVESWEEVTDEKIPEKEKELRNKLYKWKKIFREFWEDEIFKDI